MYIYFVYVITIAVFSSFAQPLSFYNTVFISKIANDLACKHTRADCTLRLSGERNIFSLFSLALSMFFSQRLCQDSIIEEVYIRSVCTIVNENNELMLSAGRSIADGSPISVHGVAGAGCAQVGWGIRRLRRSSAQDERTIRTGWSHYCPLQVSVLIKTNVITLSSDNLKKS